MVVAGMVVAGMVVAGMVVAAFARTSRGAATSVVIAVAASMVTWSIELALVVIDIGAAIALARASMGDRRSASSAMTLPEVADAIASSLAAGSTMGTAFSAGGSAARGEVSATLLSAAGQVDAGLGHAAVVEGWRAQTRGEHELRLLFSALEIGLQHPTERIPALRKAAEALRLRRLRREDTAAQVAQARSSALVVAVSPWVVLSIAGLVDPQYLRDLALSAVGQWCLIGAASLSLLGAGTIRLLINRSGLA